MNPVDLIVIHYPKKWRHIPTGEIHTTVWASPREVVSVSDSGAWLGSAAAFIREFEKLP